MFRVLVLRSVPFRSVPFRSVPFRSVPFRSVPFREIDLTLKHNGGDQHSLTCFAICCDVDVKYEHWYEEDEEQ